MFTQFAPGKSNAYYKKVSELAGIDDSTTQRLVWFKQCLSALAEELNMDKEIHSIAVPWKIGCGLAGGQWSLYEAAIKEFAGIVKHRVVIHKLP